MQPNLSSNDLASERLPDDGLCEHCWRADSTQRFRIFAIACGVPLAMSACAAIATFSRAERDVLVAAWVSAAIVGTAAVVSGAAAGRPIVKRRISPGQGQQARADERRECELASF